jgi:hypothetical protein
MADTPERPASPLRGRQLFGFPWWIWAAGGVAAVGGYLYFRHVSSQAADNSTTAAGTTGSTAGPTGLTSDQLQQFLVNQQSSPAATAKSGWIKVAGKNVYYSAKNQTLGSRQGGKWVKETL